MTTRTADRTIASRSAFVTHDGGFADVLGATPRLEQVAAVDAHEGPVYIADADVLYVTSLPRPLAHPGERAVAVRRVLLSGDRCPVGPQTVTTLVEATNTHHPGAESADTAGALAENPTLVSGLPSGCAQPQSTGHRSTAA